jgi:hypothetical protein
MVFHCWCWFRNNFEYVEAYQKVQMTVLGLWWFSKHFKLNFFPSRDDQFDWTEGWNGTNTNWYSKTIFWKRKQGIEADNF